jgi:hypothetical protein
VGRRDAGGAVRLGSGDGQSIKVAVDCSLIRNDKTFSSDLHCRKRKDHL